MADDIRFNIPVHSLLRAEEIAGRSFPKVRRGFDPAKVQAFLESVARDLRLLVEREEDLRAQLSDAERRAANPVIDEGTLTAALGQEAASLLKSARSTAAELMADAELHASEQLARSQRAADEMRMDAEAALADARASAQASLDEASRVAAEEASRIIEAATLDAERMVNDAKDECRAMIREAQELRAKVLNDMARRRRTLQIQLEQLRAGRDSLLGAVREVRRTIDRIAEDLHKAEGEARGAAEEAGEHAAGEVTSDGTGGEVTSDGTGGEVTSDGTGGEVTSDGTGGEVTSDGTGGEVTSDGTGGEPEHAGMDLVADVEEDPVVRAAGEAGTEAPGVGEIAFEAPGEQAGAGEEQAEAGEEQAEAGEEQAEAGEEQAGQAAVGDDIDGLFARIRAAAQPPTEAPRPRSGRRSGTGPGTGRGSRAAPVAQAPGAHETDGHETAPIAGTSGIVSGGVVSGVVATTSMDRSGLIKQRDEVIVEIVSGLARKLKRSLQDEQNVLLDLLRQRAKQPGNATSLVDAMAGVLGPGDRYRRASEAFLEQARMAGADYVNLGSETRAAQRMARSSPAWMQEHAANLAEAIVGPLEAKLTGDAELDLADEASVADRVGAAYRDWRGQHIELLAADAVIGVFSRSSLAAAPSGTRFAWVLDEGGASCPDCEDNSLSGPISLSTSHSSSSRRDGHGQGGYQDEVGDGGTYPTGHLHPPAHSGCRCLLVPEYLLVHEGSSVSG